MEIKTNKKLIIHETDSHGCGCVYYNGKTEAYAYDDCDIGDIKVAVQYLIRIGFIDEKDVVIFDDGQGDIYKKLDIAYTNGLLI